ncbi:hypothetical protein NUW58_g9332 [Xylaria curta]|uniref:Uncharacterized protein n=1 Tax=Xylaria curta TaxID=42375 RepID=A0ACC1MY22_9PEZI|nr:hypothetical protein NUW58_g9332 [Xylaria curta]
MYDSDVFAVLTACDKRNKARSAFDLPENRRWLRRARGGVATAPLMNSREATPADDGQPGSDDEDGAVDRLVLTFDVKNPANGIQFGTDPLLSDVLLGHRGTRGVSKRQFNIIVDDELRIFLQDLYSTHGTAVSSGGQNKDEVRKRETWILACSPRQEWDPFEKVEIHVRGLAMQIEFPNHLLENHQYLENLRAFSRNHRQALARSREEIPTVIGLELDSGPATAAPSGSWTVGERLIYFHDQVIGHGTFGNIERVMRMRDGEWFAAKTLKSTADRGRADSTKPSMLAKLRREFTLMKENPHPNVMRVHDFQESSKPFFVMDYYEDGSIRDAGISKNEDIVTTLGQILDALCHLHAKGVVHRDIKPANIMVDTSPLFKVALTDFGLSKATKDTTLLKTFCGTPKYTAPEAFPDSDGHGPKVDIWSLGVMISTLIYEIPKHKGPLRSRDETGDLTMKWRGWINSWSELILKALKDEADDNLTEILKGMMQYEAEKRWDADRCLTRGLKNGLFKRRLEDNLVVCANYHRVLFAKTPTGLLSPVAKQSEEASWMSSDPEVTIILADP